MEWRALARLGCISEEISTVFGGIGFVITHDAAVTVAVAGGATPPEVKERGWFPWAASPAMCGRRPSPWVFFAHSFCSATEITEDTEKEKEWPQMTQIGSDLRRSELIE